MSCWLYLRKSRALGDPDDPNLLEAHRTEMIRLVALDGALLLPANIREEIGSGEHIEERPRFCALLNEWRRLPSGSGGTVYVTEVARLSRGSQTEWGSIEDALRRACIKIRTRRRLFDLNDLDDCNWLEWEVLYSRFELRMNKIRFAARRAEMVRDGQIRTGRVPWGYTWDKAEKKPKPHAERFPLLQQLCREARSRSVHELAVLYGLPESTLLWTLTSPMICGWPAQRYRSYVPEKGHRKPGWRLPPEDWIWPERAGTYAAACTRPEWEALQAAIRGRALVRDRPGSDAGWCRDIVSFVGHPGRAYLGAVRPPGRPGYFSYDLRPPDGRRLYIERGPVHEAATEALRRAFTEPDWLRGALAQYEKNARERTAHATVDGAAVRRQLTRERARLTGLAKAQYDPDTTAESLLALRSAQVDTETAIERLKEDLARAEAVPPLEVDLAEIWDDLPSLCQGFEQYWNDAEALPDASRRRLARLCLAAVPVVVDPERSRRPIYREVLTPEYRDWLGPFVG